MPRGDKSAYTDKQKRQAEHIEEGYEERGVPKEEAEKRAWALQQRAANRRLTRHAACAASAASAASFVDDGRRAQVSIRPRT